MGLDITGYSKVKFVEGSDSDEIECKHEWAERIEFGSLEHFVVPYLNPHFPLHSKGLTSGVYTYEDCEDGGS